MLIISIGAHAQGVTHNGQITTVISTYVDKNGRIGSGYGLTINGKNILPEGTVVSATGKIWMDRNLGATRVAISSTDELSYGDLYQWGRGTDGHEKRKSFATYTRSSLPVPGHDLFIITGEIDWLSPYNNNLWQGVNGINNPCPTGFRLPTISEISSEQNAFSVRNSAGAFASPLKFPAAGYRVGNDVKEAGTHGYYYSSTITTNFETLSDYIYFNSSEATVWRAFRRYAFSVRCIKN